MVLAPFFLAFGAFGGGLFVASPCVGVFAFVCRCARGGCRAAAERFGCVCGATRRAAAPRFQVCPRRRFGAPAAVTALRRCAEALRGGQRGPAARRGGGVCVWAGASGAAVCGNVRRRALGGQRRWRRCGAALRRCAAASEGPRRRARGPLLAAPECRFWLSAARF